MQPIYKPDLDKLTRAVCDALSINCNLLHDDSQITEIKATKRYCLGSEEPGALVQIDVL
jgi:Holliday junction resolvase RusA-like endonuclease